jgi:hypothetical protein
MRMKLLVLATVIAAAGATGPVRAAATTHHPHVSATAQPPRVTAVKVTRRTPHRLSFSARVNPEGLATTAKLIAKYHHRTVGGATRFAGSGTTATTLHFTITHLHAHRTFRVRVSATNSAGTTHSAVIRARTRPLP